MSSPIGWIEVDGAGTGVVTVRVLGEVDLSNAEELRAEIGQALRSATAGTVDLTAVEYLDSQGVRILHEISRQARLGGIDLTVRAPTGSIAGQVLAIAQLPDLRIEA